MLEVSLLYSEKAEKEMNCQINLVMKKKKREERCLLNDVVSCQDPTASAVDELSMGAEHLWNYTDSGKAKYTPIATLPTINFT